MADNITSARYWWAVMYPENMIDNWEEKIYSLIQFPFAYCIHDKDLRHEVAEERKKHIHLIIAFNNTTTYNHALNVFKKLFAPDKIAIPNNRFEACIKVSWCFNYLIHNTDDCREKHKHLYDVSERVTGNCFDIGLFEQYSIEEKNAIINDMCLILRNNQFTNFEDFCECIEDSFPGEPIYRQLLKENSAYFERRTKGIYQRLLRKGDL